MSKKTNTFVIVTLAAFMAGVLCLGMCFVTYAEGHERGMENAALQPSGAPCWGDILMEDYVLDVVDETDFWEVCDSTAFSVYEENTSEWYLAVCLEFARIYK